MIRQRFRNLAFDLVMPRWRMFVDEERRVTKAALAVRDTLRIENAELRAKLGAAVAERDRFAGLVRLADIARGDLQERYDDMGKDRDEHFARANDASEKLRESRAECDRLHNALSVSQHNEARLKLALDEHFEGRRK